MPGLGVGIVPWPLPGKASTFHQLAFLLHPKYEAVN
jgi:hypothetical protein